MFLICHQNQGSCAYKIVLIEKRVYGKLFAIFTFLGPVTSAAARCCAGLCVSVTARRCAGLCVYYMCHMISSYLPDFISDTHT